MLNLQSTVKVSPDHVATDLDGETTILNINNGKYYGVTGVGARIWALMEQPRQVQQIHQELLQEFEVDSDRCLQDLLNVLQNFAAEGLIEVRA